MNEILANNLHDPKNIVGLSRLLPDSSECNFEELERKITSGQPITGGKAKENPIDEVKSYLDMQNNELKKMGIDIVALDKGLPLDPDKMNVNNTRIVEKFDPNLFSRPLDPPPSPKYESEYKSAPPPNFVNHRYDIPMHKDKTLNFMTEEQRQRAVLEQVIPKVDGDLHIDIIDHEQQEMDKIDLINQIKTIIDVLESENVKGLDKYKVDENDNYDRIKRVHNQLNTIHLTRSYQGLIETGITEIAGFIENTFDGKKELLGYKPNMKGYMSVASHTMKRLRPQTLEVVKSIFGSSNGKSIMTNPFLTIFFHLAGSALIHSKLQSMESKPKRKLDLQKIEELDTGSEV